MSTIVFKGTRSSRSNASIYRWVRRALTLYQRDMRHTGRPISHRKLIGTTLLVKGLEYDHAVILDADALDVKGLYVAMTRGSKSLTIIGTERYLPAK